jgi:hypothetical protein
MPPHAPPGDGGRNESNFLVYFFLALRSEPPKASTLYPGPFSPPLLRPATCDQPALPDSEASGRLLRTSVRACTAFISAGRPLAFHISRAERQARLVALTVANPNSLYLLVAGNLKTIEMRRDCPLAPFPIKNPQSGHCDSVTRRFSSRHS